MMNVAILIISCNRQVRYHYKRNSPCGGYGDSTDFDYGSGWQVKVGKVGSRIRCGR